MAAPTFDNPGKVDPKPIKLAHVILRANNFHRLTTWYQPFLNADINFQNDFMYLLSYDSEHHRIGIVNINGIATKNPQTCDLAMSYLQRKENGIEPFWCINHGPTTSVYYHDPDGNIEAQVENFETVQEAAEYMTSEAYFTNPLGVDFYMEHLVGELKKREKEEDLKKRPESGPRSLDSVPA